MYKIKNKDTGSILDTRYPFKEDALVEASNKDFHAEVLQLSQDAFCSAFGIGKVIWDNSQSLPEWV